MGLIPVMKALSDETRLRILNLLWQGDLCVCEIESLLTINQSNASRHLNKLTSAGILDYDKVAKYVYYKWNKKIVSTYPFIRDIMEKEVMGLQICMMDTEKLQVYRNSGCSCDDLKDGKLCFCNSSEDKQEEEIK